MKCHGVLLACMMGLAGQAVSAQEAPVTIPSPTPKPAVASESRDAASAFIGSMNFTVGRIGRDCLTVLGRTDTPEQFAGVWQQRNIKYVTAASTYIQARVDEAAVVGDEAKNSVLRELASVRSNAEADVNALYVKHGKDAVCRRMMALIDGGAYDITPRVPMFHELEELAAWASPP